MKNRIEDVLKDQGRAKSWLASQIGVAPATITNYCSNAYQPDWDVMIHIASLLSVKFEDLIVNGAKLLSYLNREAIEQAHMAGYNTCCKRDPSYSDARVYYDGLNKGDEDE